MRRPRRKPDPIRPKPATLAEATFAVLKAACAFRDWDWRGDGAEVIEALDIAVDDYREKLERSNPNPAETL